MEVRFRRVRVGGMDLWECQLCKCKFATKADCRHHVEYHRLLKEGKVDPPPREEGRIGNARGLAQWMQ